MKLLLAVVAIYIATCAGGASSNAEPTSARFRTGRRARSPGLTTGVDSQTEPFYIYTTEITVTLPPLLTPSCASGFESHLEHVPGQEDPIVICLPIKDASDNAEPTSARFRTGRKTRSPGSTTGVDSPNQAQPCYIHTTYITLPKPTFLTPSCAPGFESHLEHVPGQEDPIVICLPIKGSDNDNPSGKSTSSKGH